MKLQATQSLLLILSVCCFLFSLVFSRTAHSEILIRVKNARIDDPNGKLGDWVLTGDRNPCNWTGIGCDPQKDNVISIDLSGFGLSGGFPYDFCRIRTLRNLTLSENNFNGTLSSDALSLCSRLHVLNLSDNLFVGELPEFSPEFGDLQLLDLSLNNFTGDMPVSFGRLRSLRVLTLTSNLLNGSIPSFLCNLSELTRFELGYNPFKPGPLPSEVGNLTKLEYLWLPISNLYGEIPDSIGKLVWLKNLDLSNNFLRGNIPESIGNLRSIEQIVLYMNQLSGELPESIGNLSNLLKFDVSQNNLTGKLHSKIAAMNLVSLNLNDNFFGGEVPEILASNPNLQQLKLFNNSFSGNLPETLGKNSDVEDFDVSGNDLTGKLPPYLCYRKKLQRIVAFNNRFSGNIPDSYGACNTLNYVRIGNNEFSGEVPNKFWGLRGVQFLELQNNKFHGSISRSITGARELDSLLISRNNFSGEIPSEICRLHELVVIDVSKNQLAGELPACLTDLNKLQKLEMQENVLSGRIPSSISSWTDLTEFNLSRNRFTGNIPPELGNLPVLTYLDLAGNSLSGEIPVELTKLRLNKFNVSDNKLYGKVPSGFNHELFVSSLMGNPHLCSPDLKPLPPCPNPNPKPATLYVVLAILALCSLILIGSLFWFFKTKSNALGKKPKRPWKVTTFQRVGFNEDEVIAALKAENLIGSGGSGRVYKVKLKSGQTVAVKKLWGGIQNRSTESVFRSEVETLGRVRHCNIVKLLFSCIGDDCRILVYEYIENGSLGDVLHGEKKGGRLLDWHQRFTIAVGAAQGLAYLHHDCVPAIVHRDVKSNNILLDEELRPRVADFGLAKTLQREVAGEGDCAMSRIAGSYGYIAPEYGYTLKVTEKSDVYSFGVVLMELITGKRPNDPSFGENKDLVKWVTESALSSEGRSGNTSTCCMDLRQLVDPKITYNQEEMEKVLNVALLCTSAFPMNRPAMRRVVELLKDQNVAPPK